MNALPANARYFRYLAPLYPLAFESFDLSAFDTVVSSTTAWAKGVRTAPGCVHVCYINTVSRFTFDYDRYAGGFGLHRAARPIRDWLVRWDRAASARPTVFVANSHNVARRIERYYGRESVVLHCPVEIDRFTPGSGGAEYFFLASRLLPYKRIDLAIRAAKLAGVPLIVAGTGPAERELRRLAEGSTTTLLGYVDDATFNAYLGRARAAIVAAEEDFGLAPLEAAAAGRPTIAYRSGGALETIIEGTTGEFFDAPAPESLARALRAFDERRYDSHALREHAQRFSPERFVERLRAIVEETRATL